MRATTLKASSAGLGNLLAYYAGLADDQVRRDGLARGPVDYYLDPAEPAGRWWGHGCGTLGLDGQVGAEELEALLVARHPRTGSRLGRRFGAKSARAFDATFSAPKSVSILWALSPDPLVRGEVLAAHDMVVQAALDWFEQAGAVTRRGKDGVHQVDAQRVAAALFRQQTSRSADPQLHTHAIVAAKVQDPTGAWMSLDARFLKRQQRTIGWVYAAALRAELTARLGVAWRGVTEGMPTWRASRPRCWRSSRSAPSRWRPVWPNCSPSGPTPTAAPIPTLARCTAWSAWRCSTAGRAKSQLAMLTPCGRRGASGRSDSASGRWTRPPDRIGCRARVPSTGKRSWARPMERVASSASAWLAVDLAREIATLVPADAAASAAELVALVDELTADAAGRCVELHPAAAADTACRRDGRPVTEHVVDRQLTTTAVWRQEARLLAWARDAIGSPTTTGHADTQAEVADAVSGRERPVLVVGPAGAGKTSALGRAAHLLAEQGRPTLGLAPSGKAADVLATETGWPAATVAKLLHEHGRPGGRGRPGGWRPALR